MAETPNTVFLLGAGFTKAIFPAAPLNNDLLQKIICFNSKTPLNKYLNKYNTNDIEILLTRLDLEIAQNSSEKENFQNDRKTIDGNIAKYFERFRFTKGRLKANKWLETLATKLFKENNAIITTNYDCFLEGLLDHYKVWSPSKGYGGVKIAGIGTSVQNLPNPKNILIYKIHGSENFQTCAIDSKDIDQREINAMVSPKIYPKSGANSYLGTVAGRSYIIAPSFVKTFYLQIQIMMIESLQAASKARNFIIIGCGLRPEDNFLWLLLTSFLNRNINNGRLIIVDPIACMILEKIRNFWVGNTEHINFISISQKMKEGLGDLIKLLEDCKTNG